MHQEGIYPEKVAAMWNYPTRVLPLQESIEPGQAVYPHSRLSA